MYSLADARRLVSNPKLAIRELNRLYHTKGRTTNGNPRGINFFEQNWDVCLILDSCRYDYFRQSATGAIEGKLARRESLASATIEWVNTNLRGEQYHDTVYVSSNPKLYNSTVEDDVFHDTIYSWERTDGEIDDLSSVDPELMADLTKQALEDYPNKRICAHFMQPHCPFLGERGREEFPDTPWGYIIEEWPDTKENLRDAYVENIEYVLPYIKSVLEEVDGRAVVTADHGQLLGERVHPIPIREFAHPAGIYVPELVEVPWFVQESTERRHIVSEPPTRTPADTDERDVEELLEQLGYR